MFDIDALVEYIQQQGYCCYVIYRGIVLYIYIRGEKTSWSLAFEPHDSMDYVITPHA